MFNNVPRLATTFEKIMDAAHTWIQDLIQLPNNGRRPPTTERKTPIALRWIYVLLEQRKWHDDDIHSKSWLESQKKVSASQTGNVRERTEGNWRSGRWSDLSWLGNRNNETGSWDENFLAIGRSEKLGRQGGCEVDMARRTLHKATNAKTTSRVSRTAKEAD